MTNNVNMWLKWDGNNWISIQQESDMILQQGIGYVVHVREDCSISSYGPPPLP